MRASVFVTDSATKQAEADSRLSDFSRITKIIPENKGKKSVELIAGMAVERYLRRVWYSSVM